MKDLFIHVGYPKTATTTLQKTVFSSHSEIDYLNHKVDSLLFKYLREDSSLFLSTRLREKIKELETHIKLSEKRVLVISNESFSSTSMQYGLIRRNTGNKLICIPDQYTVIRNLYLMKALLNDYVNVHIIVGIRNQSDFIRSYYAQEYTRFYSKSKYTKTFKEFLDFSLKNQDAFMIKSLNYFEIIKVYKELFGTNNVKVLIFEDLKMNSKEFFTNLAAEILKIDLDETLNIVDGKYYNVKRTIKGYKSDGIAASKLLVRIFQRLGLNPKLGFTRSRLYQKLGSIKLFERELLDVHLSNEDHETILALFNNSNRSLEKMINRDLSTLGY